MVLYKVTNWDMFNFPTLLLRFVKDKQSWTLESDKPDFNQWYSAAIGKRVRCELNFGLYRDDWAF